MGLDLTGLGSVATFAKDIVDRVWPPQASSEDKLKAAVEIQQSIESREKAALETQKAIMVAELQQDDKFTKRGRPTILYAGLVFIFTNHVLFPIVSWLIIFFSARTLPDGQVVADLPALPTISLPAEFWWAWTGVCGLYVLGRTAEKQGSPAGGLIGKTIELIGGKKQ